MYSNEQKSGQGIRKGFTCTDSAASHWPHDVVFVFYNSSLVMIVLRIRTFRRACHQCLSFRNFQVCKTSGGPATKSPAKMQKYIYQDNMLSIPNSCCYAYQKSHSFIRYIVLPQPMTLVVFNAQHATCLSESRAAHQIARRSF